MAGVKGKSGGKREGAGRKPNPPPETVTIDTETDDPLQLLMDIAYGRIEVAPNQVRAAIAAVQYTHAKIGEGGKKQKKQEAAAQVAKTGRFQPSAPPKLAVVR